MTLNSIYILLSEMLSRQNSVLKIEMWLAVQYWEMFYNDSSEDEHNDDAGDVGLLGRWNDRF